MRGDQFSFTVVEGHLHFTLDDLAAGARQARRNTGVGAGEERHG